jgi:phospholipid/cholesterol/gamma-HCH transport system permease protein
MKATSLALFVVLALPLAGCIPNQDMGHGPKADPKQGELNITARQMIAARPFVEESVRASEDPPAGVASTGRGGANMASWRVAGEVVEYVLEAVGGAFASITRRPGAILEQFERVALGSVGLIAVAGLSIGLVTWLQLHRLLAAYGFEASLPGVLAVAVLVETGPILASLLVAGRLGAGLAAELGSMNLTEELDAITVLGAPPVPTLVGPRLVACTLATPLLAIVIDGAALAGGLLAELCAGNLSPAVYSRHAFEYIRLCDTIPATLKTAVFGAIVGLVGCWTGLHAERSTEAVGRAATRGVVRSMLAVFAADVALVPLIQTFVAAIGWTT